jgi:hypothetical protein
MMAMVQDIRQHQENCGVDSSTRERETTRPCGSDDVSMKPVREVFSLVATASKYHNRTHVMLPAAWDGEYVIAVLDKKRDGMKIAHIAVKFGNGAHLILPHSWACRRVYCKRVDAKKSISQPEFVRF